MKKTLALTLCLAFACSLSMLADSYASMWKQHAALEEKDQPQSQLKILSKIADKAKAERAYGHLLKAQMKELTAQVSISPDSLLPLVQRLEGEERKAETADVALAAVYQAVLGHIYANHTELSDSSAQVSKAWQKKSLSHPEALAKAYVTAYEPFAEQGVDSRIFGYDLLHVVGMLAGDYDLLHKYYSEHQNRSAACLCALQLLRETRKSDETRMKKSKYLQSVDSLLREYQDLEVAGEVAIEHYSFMETAEDASAEKKNDFINYALTHWGAWPRMSILRNAQRRLTQPSFHVSLGEELLTPNTPRQVVVMSVCNLNELKMTVRRVNVSGDTQLSPSNSKDYEKLRKLLSTEIAAQQTRRYVGLPDYKVSRDTMEIAGLPVGVYLVEFSTSNTSVPVERRLLRVCNLFPVVESLPDKTIRMAVLDATDGLPVAGAKVKFTTESLYGEDAKETILTCDENGELSYHYEGRAPHRYRVYTDQDNAFSSSYLNNNFSYYEAPKDVVQTSVNLYTDRALYRPGQTVHVGVVAHESSRSAGQHVVGGKQLKLTLRDANYKEVATQEVTTDELGVAAADFLLPSNGLTGRFSVRSSEHGGYVSFAVEEYKRPTFRVEFDKVTVHYQAGDTLTLTGYAKSFAGVPVQGARVAYTITRTPSMRWCWRSSRFETTEMKRDTLQTDGQGMFTVQVPMDLPETDEEHPRRYYSFDIAADVTDLAGETRHGETSIPLSDHPTAFTCELSEKMERDSIQSLTFIYRNNAGENVDAEVTYTIDGAHYFCPTNKKEILPVAQWPTGKHELMAICGQDTLRTSFVTFSMNDTKVATETHDWFYLSANKFAEDAQKPVYLQLGASDSTLHVVYTILAGKQVLENGAMDLKNGDLLTRTFYYKEAYGDGIRLTYAWVKGGKLYSHSEKIVRPQPDKHLTLAWKTFRDRLTPGQKEEWQLTISHPDGTAAKASLMATLYDRSLDDIKKHAWSTFSFPDYARVPSAKWTGRNVGEVFMYGEMPYRSFKERDLDFYHFCLPSYYDLLGHDQVFIERHAMVSPQMLSKAGAMSVKSKEKVMEIASTSESNNDAAADSNSGTSIETTEGTTDATTKQQGESQEQVRDNFEETAFFCPTLQTDASGNVSIKFTLPESITTWRFLGLAHDKEMNNGSLEGEAVAKKTVMVSPNVPRFVRSGDQGQIASRIINTSEKTVSGTATMQLIDPESEKTVYTQSKKFTVKAEETTSVSFDFDMNKLKHEGLLVCKIVASGSGFSDGEQHYLPVLPDKQLVTNTVAFTLNEAGTKTIDLTSLFAVKDASNKLTVEYTANPSWLAIQALPSVALPSSDNAISLATAIYANTVAKHILGQSPNIKQTLQLWAQEEGKETSLSSNLQKNEELKTMLLEETPWMLDADNEAAQKQQLINYFDEPSLQFRLSSALQKLQQLQNPDGSFSWWPGMKGNVYLTQAVAETFIRLNKMTTERTATANSLLTSALKYLAQQASKEVAELKKAEKKGEKNLCPSSSAVNYLYLCALDGRKLAAANQANCNYLVALLDKNGSARTIQQKAQMAVVFAKFGKQQKAAELLQSLKEYTVYKEETGRYYDTPKAGYSWCDYRIPTQVSAIEVLKLLQPDEKQFIAQMQQWLLQSKRTQSWDTPVNAVNAVYAFLDGNSEKLSSNSGSQATLKVNGSKLPTTGATAGLGYVKTTKTGENLRTFSVSKPTEGTSWGAVYAQFLQPTTEVAGLQSGITVKRELWKDGRKLSDSDTACLTVGDKVTVRITLTADRDYDFVQVSDCRAACLEPAEQLSGYRYGYYCSPKDNLTNYYFDCLPKGKSQIETTYYINREGTYHSGTCTAQCAYSPEYMGRTAAITLQVKK